jgi:capsular polysaccharide biosynthesis protein
MANLMFCPPGTKIIEIAPNDNYRPFFTLISSKLGLTHAIMPCPTQTGGFFSHVQVDMGRLRALRRMLDKRHAG